MEKIDSLQRQSLIYKEIGDEQNSIKQTGISPKENILAGESGYLIALRHPTEVVQKVSEMSILVNNFVPSITYDADNIHTTLISFSSPPGLGVDEGIIAGLSNSLKLNLTSLKEKIKIDYEGWLVTRDAVIAKGIAQQNFFGLASDISEELKTFGIEANPIKMGHITTARFLESRTGEQAAQLIDKVNNVPLSIQSFPKTVIVGSFVTNTNGFDLDIFEKADI